MKIYIAYRIYDHNETFVIGVFYTHKKAKEACDNDPKVDPYYGHDIEQIELNKAKY